MIDINLNAVKGLYNDMMDMLVSTSGLAVPCSLVHEDPTGSGCPNCKINPVTGRSTSRYKFATVNPVVGDEEVPDDMYIVYMDENSKFYASGGQAIQQSGLDLFRLAYPSALVFVLDVAPSPLNIVYPTGFFNDNKVFSSKIDSSVTISRDNGVASGATDSFQVIQNLVANSSGVNGVTSGLFNNVKTATISRGVSSSLTTDNISATYSGLLSSLAATGITVNNTNVFRHDNILCGFATNQCVEKTSFVSDFLDYCDQHGSGTISNTFCSGQNIPAVGHSQEASGNFIWFPEGHICPVCNGVGSFPLTHTDTANIVVVFDSKKFISLGNVDVPQVDMQTITSIDMYTDLTVADYITVDPAVTPYTRNKFTRVSEPQPVGLGSNRYIFTNWERKS
tara:strand:- start:182 stop:1363 length:1182 start_codon:yes stop_codon:yes gene_type:complete